MDSGAVWDIGRDVEVMMELLACVCKAKLMLRDALRLEYLASTRGRRQKSQKGSLCRFFLFPYPSLLLTLSLSLPLPLLDLLSLLVHLPPPPPTRLACGSARISRRSEPLPPTPTHGQDSRALICSPHPEQRRHASRTRGCFTFSARSRTESPAWHSATTVLADGSFRNICILSDLECHASAPLLSSIFPRPAGC